LRQQLADIGKTIQQVQVIANVQQG